MKRDVEINTPNGLGTIEKMWISELGFLMIKVYFKEKKIWVSYNLGEHDSMNNIFNDAITKSSKN